MKILIFTAVVCAAFLFLAMGILTPAHTFPNASSLCQSNQNIMTGYAPYFPPAPHQRTDVYNIHLEVNEHMQRNNVGQTLSSTCREHTKRGAVILIPYAVKLLAVFTAIALITDDINGDAKIFFIQKGIETALCLFLIFNWYGSGIDLMGHLYDGAHRLGAHMGGTGHPDALIDSAVTILSAGFDRAEMLFSAETPSSGTFAAVCLLISSALLLFAAIEILLDEFIFHIVAMFSILLIPFFAPSRTKILMRALCKTFTLALNVYVMLFVTKIVNCALSYFCLQFVYIAKIRDADAMIPAFTKIVFISLMIYLLVKKIPERIQGIFNK